MKPNLEALYVARESLQGLSDDLRERAKKVDDDAKAMEHEIAALLARPVTPGAVLLVGRKARLALVREIQLEAEAYRVQDRKPVRDRVARLAVRFWDDYQGKWSENNDYIDSTKGFVLLDRTSVEQQLGIKLPKGAPPPSSEG